MLPVHEQFHTFQGEGLHAGRSAWFVRLFGCPVHCPWCDSAGTWHPHYSPPAIERLEPAAIAAKARAAAPEFVVITGGEPAIHDLNGLTDALADAALPVHLETSGAFSLRGRFDWVTLSPKRWKLPLADNWLLADELKLIVDTPGAIEEYLRHARAHGIHLSDTKPIWLHPEWSLRDAPDILRAIAAKVKAEGAPFRAGWQLHKHYAVDRLDPGSKPAVPLGGDPARGF